MVAGGGWSCRCSQPAPLATHCCQHPTHQSWANPPWPDPSRRPPCSHPRMLGVSENEFGEGGHEGRPADQRACSQGTGQPRTTHRNGHCEFVNNCEMGGGWGDVLGTAQGTPVRRPYTGQRYESAAKSTARGKQILGSFASVRWPFRAAVAGPCSQPSHLLTCKIAGAAGVSILRIAVPRSEKPETDRKTPGWLLNS